MKGGKNRQTTVVRDHQYMLVLFSDLDGTLLSSKTCSYAAARPALDLIHASDTPLVFCTSRTRPEVELWRRRLANRHPFIVENGGALFIPDSYFPVPLRAPVRRDGYAVVEFGASYADLTATLSAAAAESGCEIRPFHRMSDGEIARTSRLPKNQAALARQREYDEPFEVVGPGADKLLAGIEKRGKRWTRDRLFYHIHGGNDTAACVKVLSDLYRQSFDRVVTVGLADALDDTAFLNAVDIPILVRSDVSEQLKKAVPRAHTTLLPGPQGWNEAVTALLLSRG